MIRREVIRLFDQIGIWLKPDVILDHFNYFAQIDRP
jgi:hypothetical protein